MDIPTARVVTAGSNVDVRFPAFAPWRRVTTDLPATLPLKAIVPSAGARMASCVRACKSTPRWPGNHCLAGASYAPTIRACSKGHRINARHSTCAASPAAAISACAYAGGTRRPQATNAALADTHTIIAAAHRRRLRSSASSDILLRRIRRRYSLLSMLISFACVAVGNRKHAIVANRLSNYNDLVVGEPHLSTCSGRVAPEAATDVSSCGIRCNA